MKFSKKFFAPLALGTLLLAGCQGTTSNTLTFATPAANVTFNAQNQNTMVNVVSQDLRASAEIASYTQNSNLVRLTASPEVAQMFQQVMQQNLNSKGFKVVQGAGNANVQVNVRKFFANVDSGNLMYSINAEVTLEVLVKGSRGHFNKTFNATRGQEGVLGVSNDDIQKLLAMAYSDVVRAVYNDNEIGNAIHQYK